jgi:predicted NUDIX family phosphoesterase
VHQNSSRELKEEISDVSEAEALEALEFLVLLNTASEAM